MFGIKCTFLEPLGQLCDDWFDYKINLTQEGGRPQWHFFYLLPHAIVEIISFVNEMQIDPNNPPVSHNKLRPMAFHVGHLLSLNVNHLTWDNRKIKRAITAANTPLFQTANPQHEPPRTIGAGECADPVYCWALTSLDDHLFICFESVAVWWGCVTYPHSYSLFQVGIKVINAPFDRCWKVSLKHERTGIITHSAMFPSLQAHVSTLASSSPTARYLRNR